MDYKRCSKCNKLKPATKEYFHKAVSGLCPWCKICRNKQKKEYRKANREKVRNAVNKCKVKDPEKWREYNKNWRQNKMKTDPQFALSIALRDRVREAFRSYSRVGKVKKSCEYGINYKAIVKHLGPCPGIRSEWHIDHIIPLSSFNLDDEEQILKAFAPENHQWLPAKENLRKGAKLQKGG